MSKSQKRKLKRKREEEEKKQNKIEPVDADLMESENEAEGMEEEEEIKKKPVIADGGNMSAEAAAMLPAMMEIFRAAFGTSNGKKSRSSDHKNDEHSASSYDYEQGNESSDEEEDGRVFDNDVVKTMNEIIAGRAMIYKGQTGSLLSLAMGLYSSHINDSPTLTIPSSSTSSSSSTAGTSPASSSNINGVELFCCKALLTAPLIGSIYPCRRSDIKNKEAKELVRRIASGRLIENVIDAFSSTRIGEDVNRSLTSMLIGERSQTNHTMEIPLSLQWINAMNRYREALCLFHPDQNKGMEEYIRFISELFTILPYDIVNYREIEWRRHVSTMGVPINDRNALWVHWHEIINKRLSGYYLNQKRSAAAAITNTNSGNAKKTINVKGKKGNANNANDDGKKRPCFNWNNGEKCRSDPCEYAHICEECFNHNNAFRRNHQWINCIHKIKKQKAALAGKTRSKTEGNAGNNPSAPISSSGSGSGDANTTPSNSSSQSSKKESNERKH